MPKSFSEIEDRDRVRRVHKKGRVRICHECQAVSTAKRWYYNDAVRDKCQQSPGETDYTLCPGCTGIHGRLIGGFIDLKGEWDEGQKRDLLHLIEHVSRYSQRRNPANRIIALVERPGALYLETTTNWLAEHIGKEVHKAFPGELTLQWPKGDAVVRVYYERRLPVGAGAKPRK